MCLNTVHPSVSCKKSKLVGGAWKSEYFEKEINTWNKKLRVSEFNQILKHNGLEKIPESLIEESYLYNTIQITHSVDQLV